MSDTKSSTSHSHDDRRSTRSSRHEDNNNKNLEDYIKKKDKVDQKKKKDKVEEKEKEEEEEEVDAFGRLIPKNHKRKKSISPSRGHDSKYRREKHGHTRSRSRSRSRERKRRRRSSSRERREDSHYRDRHRDRGRDDREHHSSKSPHSSTKDKKKKNSSHPSDSVEGMMATMGLPVGFNSTKGKQVKGNYQGLAKIKSEREYRQYMNRRGGFNRLLDPEPTASRYGPGGVPREILAAQRK